MLLVDLSLLGYINLQLSGQIGRFICVCQFHIDVSMCPISVAYSMGQIVNSVCLCLCVCLSVGTLTVAFLD